METFEGLQNIDNFCKVIVKKSFGNQPAIQNRSSNLLETARAGSTINCAQQTVFEEPFVDVFDEEDHIRILVQCRCLEQQVTLYHGLDGIVVCRKEGYKEKNGSEVCNDVCKKLNIKTDGLQLDGMVFIVSKCNNNNTLETMIPKIKK